MGNRDGRTLFLGDNMPSVDKERAELFKLLGLAAAAIALAAGVIGLHDYDQSDIKTTCVEANANGGQFTRGEREEVAKKLGVSADRLSAEGFIPYIQSRSTNRSLNGLGNVGELAHYICVYKGRLGSEEIGIETDIKYPFMEEVDENQPETESE